MSKVTPAGCIILKSEVLVNLAYVSLTLIAEGVSRERVDIIVAPYIENYVSRDFGKDFRTQVKHIVVHYHYLTEFIEYLVSSLDMIKEEVADAAVLFYVLFAKLAGAYISVLVQSYHKVFAREECGNLCKISIEECL